MKNETTKKKEKNKKNENKKKKKKKSGKTHRMPARGSGCLPKDGRRQNRSAMWPREPARQPSLTLHRKFAGGG
eukprot:CAMPEP_0206488760 /NCGR_PEP_ID=MMETSP0324_2-20121206/42658_1 /ASSEMBLY_ACC=CAM_ASM_000836 /TAXON_ID=2866 /ORGANISM="Crypthecodinium cohnii, Strain Seligo" /LENGTH=72 /DNA_ID=CAMNT_0053967953 /DNA_START=478 /DNA_END=692 /DNA_ORIENTATION=-